MFWSSRYRWIICLLLFLITVCSYVNRQTFSLVAPGVAVEYHFTNLQLATIINAFLVAYTFGQLFSGRLLDWIGSRKGFALSAFVWSLTTSVTSLARGVWSFSFFRFLLGLAESANFPGGVKVVAEWFPPTERSTAVGIFSSGASIGAILTPPIVVYLILHFGWRFAFVSVGIPGLLWAFVWYNAYSPSKAHLNVNRGELSSFVSEDRKNADSSELESAVPWGFILRQRKIWGIFLGRFIEEPASWFYFNWLAIYLRSSRAVPLPAIGFLLIFPYLTLDAGYIGGGWASSQLMKSGWSLDKARKIVMVLSALVMISSIPAVYAKSTIGFILLVSIATFGHGSWGANIFTLPGDIVPNRLVGTVYGITAFGGGIGSIIFTQVTGQLVDMQKSFNTVFLIAGILPVLAAIVFVTVSGTMNRIDIPLSQ